jgi:hypothetical protein
LRIHGVLLTFLVSPGLKFKGPLLFKWPTREEEIADAGPVWRFLLQASRSMIERTEKVV